MHLVDPARLEVFRALAPHVEANLHLLLPVDAAWQPTDFLPDFAAPDAAEQLGALRASAQALPDPVLVVLVGDLVTEEALPSYSMALNGVVGDLLGDSSEPWPRWLRGWTAEENRHGDVLNAWLRLSGRVDMRAVERTVHHLLANGFNARAYPDPYATLVYGAFQERATRISHANVARLVAQAGDATLARVCHRIAGDEARHETFYTRMMGHLLAVDPAGGLGALRHLLRSMIVMPGLRMEDGGPSGLFHRFAAVAHRLGVYTVHDYAAIMEQLLTTWEIRDRAVSGEAAADQEWLCRQPERWRSRADELAAGVEEMPPAPFAWVHGREV